MSEVPEVDLEEVQPEAAEPIQTPVVYDAPAPITEGTQTAVNGLPPWARAAIYWFFTPVGAAAGGVTTIGITGGLPLVVVQVASIVSIVSVSLLGAVALSNVTRTK